MFNAEFGAHYHAGAKAETTSADVQLKINKDGFCIHHPDVQVEKKGMFRTKRTECYRCKQVFEIRIKQEQQKLGSDSTAPVTVFQSTSTATPASNSKNVIR